MTDLIDQWTALGTDAHFTDPKEFAVKLDTLERRVRRRNLVEYIAGGFVMAVFAWTAWLTAQAGEVFITFGWLLGIVGMAVILTSLRHRASNLPRRPESDCRSHLRAQLEHQRKALESVPRWYLAPLVPGVALVILGSALPIARDAGWGMALAGIGLPAAVVVAIFAGVAWLNRRAARMLSREIAALDELA